MRAAAPFLAAALLAAGCSNDGTGTAASTEPRAAASAAGAAIGTVALQEESPALRAQAKISDPEARALALQRVPGGRIVEAELEEEGGRLLYSYEIHGANGRGVVEVEIDATTGAVLSEEHEEDDGADAAPEREDDDRAR